MSAGDSWAELSSEEKRSKRIEVWRNPPVEFVSDEAEAEYKARVDRLTNALSLEVPDRIPVHLMMGHWPAKRAGLTPFEAMRDPARAARAWTDFNLEFQPDAMAGPVSYVPPPRMLEQLDYRLFSWPGHGSPKDVGFQCNEKDWMLPEEYDEFIADPVDYLLRTFLPRTVGAFAGFAGTRSLFDFVELPFVSGYMTCWGSSDMVKTLESLTEAARAAMQWSTALSPELDRRMSLGFPSYEATACICPFDILGDTLRGMRGIMVDMYRCPDKVLEACDRLVPLAIDWALRGAKPLSTPLVCIPLHKGADGFMSDEQFKTFYWPTLRQVLIGLIDEGIIPFLFAEGRYGSRLETIMDLPAGKTVWLFDRTDMAWAKETIGKVACIQGNVPLSLLHAGTPEAVADYTRGLIEVAGEGGGFILDMGAVADDGREENLRAMIDTARLYGVY